MKLGCLVSHNPSGSPIENILRKLSHDELDPDFSIGIVVEVSNKSSLILANENPGLYWYDNNELLSIETSAKHNLPVL